MRAALLWFGVVLVAPRAASATEFVAEDSARPRSRGSWQTGLVSSTEYGATDGVRIGLHPIVLWVLPHARGTVTWWQRGRASLGSRHGLSYPTPFLRLISREGSGGLLPANTRVPRVVQTYHDLLASTRLFPGHELDSYLGFGVGFGNSDELPLLDFPLLYQRFVGLQAPWVMRGGVALQGEFASGFTYAMQNAAWLFTLDELDGAGLAVESTFLAGFDLAPSWRVLGGFKSALAKFPIGARLHLLPLVDLCHAF